MQTILKINPNNSIIDHKSLNQLATYAIAEAKRRIIIETAEKKKREEDEAPYRYFQQKYYNDPAGFIVDCFVWERNNYPTDYQLEIVTDLYLYKRECDRGPRGLGKTAVASWVTHWFALTRDGLDWKIPITASAWVQLTKFYWPEVHKWAKYLRWEIIGRKPYSRTHELFMQSMRLETGEAFAMTNKKSELTEGAHADHMLYIFDESKSIADNIFDSAEGSLGAAEENPDLEAMALAISTPGDPIGRFYDIQKRKEGYEDWHVRHVTKEEAIKAGRISRKWCEQRKKQWGAKSQLYLNHVEGKFAPSQESGVIPLAWIEAAIDRWKVWRDEDFPGNITGVGSDIGGGQVNNDLSTVAPCYEYTKIKEVLTYPVLSADTAMMEMAGNIIAAVHREPSVEIFIDVIGLGAGVAHRLSELRYNVYHFIASNKTNLVDSTKSYGFSNWRSAGWWLVREMLDPRNEFDVCIPADDDLLGELCAPKYHTTSNGLIVVEDKLSIRSRLQRSTDRADAVIHILTGSILYNASLEDKEEVIYRPYPIRDNYS